MDVMETFWRNVDWHRQVKGLCWKDLANHNVKAAQQGTLNVTLATVQKIAAKLDISDYAILFERTEDWECADLQGGAE